MTFGEKLKAARVECGFKQAELAKKLNTTGNTISNWENNVSKPDLDTLSYICGILHVKASYFLHATLPEDDVSIPELTIIKKYRALDALGQSHIDAVLQWETDRVVALQKKDNHIKDLETRPAALSGISLNYSEDRMRFFSYYQRMASAGNGEFLFPDIPTDVIAVPDTPLSRRADFVIGINGKSMEPTYFDGDKVLVEKTNSVSIGEIGIFIMGTECFIKESGKDRLISHNKDKVTYPDIIPDERRIDTIGRVLGKIGE